MTNEYLEFNYLYKLALTIFYISLIIMNWVLLFGMDFIRWTVLMVFLLCSSFVLFLLSPAPIMIKKKFVSMLLKNEEVKKFTVPAFRATLICLFILFADAIRQTYTFSTMLEIATKSQVHMGQEPHVKAEYETKFFTSQRNLFFDGATIFLMYVLDRFNHLILHIAETEEEVENLNKELHNMKEKYGNIPASEAAHEPTDNVISHRKKDE